MEINVGRVGTARINAVKAPSIGQNRAAALRKVKHPDAPYEADALERELQQQRDELAEMSGLLAKDPEGFDRYFDQVAETGEVKQGDSVTVTVEQVPVKKTPPRKRAARKTAQKKAVGPSTPVMEIEASPPSIVPIIPVPPAQPGSQTVQQEE